MTQGGRILIVDDLPENLAVLGGILKKAGYQIRATLSGELALNAAVIEPPDLILLDIMMPEMDGYSVCQQMKANPQTADIPILFISALSDTTDKVKAFAAGGVDFITKPFDDSEVLARVSVHTALALARRQLVEKNQALERALLELQQAQSQLVSSAKMASLGVLTAGLAHELNNPINFVFANAQSCLKLLPQLEKLYDRYDALSLNNVAAELQEIADQKEAMDYQECRAGLRQLLEGIRVGADRTANIIRSLRLFSREGAALATVFDLNDNINTALLMLGAKIGKDIRVEKDFRARPMAMGQPGPLNQVLVNLISNAADAIQAKPVLGKEETIRIDTYNAERDERPVLVIEVSDTGMGLSAEAMPHLFEPFYSTKPVGKGVGLGLSIADSIVQEHGGTLEAENVEGQGACFRIVLPRYAGVIQES